LNLSGVHGVTQKDGTISLVDDKNKEIFTVPQGLAWDSASTPSTTPVIVKLSSDGKSLDVSIDSLWAADPVRVFPLVIDPAIDLGRNSGHWDAFTSSANPNTNYNGNAQIDQNAYVDKVGYSSFPSSEYRSYMQFDASSLSNKQILSANLNFYLYSGSGAALKIYPNSQSWSDTSITWNSPANHYADTITTTPGLNWNAINMTSWVQNWADGTWGANGVAMDTAGQNGYWRIAAAESYSQGTDPYISVTYNTKQ
jgi:hypothetical protein